MKFLHIFILVSISGFSAFGQQDCELRLDKDSIRVYLCEMTNSRYKSVKTTFEVNSSLSQLAAMVLDIDHYDAWQYKTVSATILKKVSEKEIIYHTEASAPMIASNRDFVIDLTIRQDPRTRVLTIDAISIPDYLPVRPNVIRVPFSKAQWVVRPLNASTLQVDYLIEIDLGGAVPPWIVNMVAHQAPYQTFRDFRDKIGDYRGIKVGFIKD